MQVGEPHMLARAGAGGKMLGTSMGGYSLSETEKRGETSDYLPPSSVACTVLPHGVQVIDCVTSKCTNSWGLKGKAPLLPALVSYNIVLLPHRIHVSLSCCHVAFVCCLGFFKCHMLQRTVCPGVEVSQSQRHIMMHWHLDIVI